MRTSRRLLALAAASAAATVLVAAPASADPVPDGTVFVSGWYAGQVYTGTVTNPALAAVGAASGTNWMAGLDIDGATGLGYAVTYTTDPAEEDGPNGDAQLFAVDGATGATTLVGTVTRNGEPVEHCEDLDYTAGVILIACEYDVSTGWIATVDPVTAAATIVVDNVPRTQAIARLGDYLVGFGYEGVVYSADLTDGTVTDEGVVATPGLYPAGADFDAQGVLYLSGRGSMEPFQLWTFDVATLTGVEIGDLALDGADVGVGEDVSVVGPAAIQPAAPTLPNTGTDATLPLAAAAALLLAGLALLLRRRTPVVE